LVYHQAGTALQFQALRILMDHLVETMAYVGATPWHGLGN
jgi:hypothetical protein